MLSGSNRDELSQFSSLSHPPMYGSDENDGYVKVLNLPTTTVCSTATQPEGRANVHTLRHAGQAVIQFAECKDDHSEYAIKFFLERESFLTEAALYTACLPAVPGEPPESATGDPRPFLPRTLPAGSDQPHMPEAVARCLPQLEAVVDCEAFPLMDPRGRPLPSCIVMEKGDSLHDWNDRAEPDIFTILAVCCSCNLDCRICERHHHGCHQCVC